jgi:hypothetical protein
MTCATTTIGFHSPQLGNGTSGNDDKCHSDAAEEDGTGKQRILVDGRCWRLMSDATSIRPPAGQDVGTFLPLHLLALVATEARSTEPLPHALTQAPRPAGEAQPTARIRPLIGVPPTSVPMAYTTRTAQYT